MKRLKQGIVWGFIFGTMRITAFPGMSGKTPGRLTSVQRLWIVPVAGFGNRLKCVIKMTKKKA